MSLLISGLDLPRKGMYKTITIYSDGKVVYKFGGAEAGFATQLPESERLTVEDGMLDGQVKYSMVEREGPFATAMQKILRKLAFFEEAERKK